MEPPTYPTQTRARTQRRRKGRRGSRKNLNLNKRIIREDEDRKKLTNLDYWREEIKRRKMSGPDR